MKIRFLLTLMGITALAGVVTTASASNVSISIAVPATVIPATVAVAPRMVSAPAVYITPPRPPVMPVYLAPARPVPVYFSPARPVPPVRGVVVVR